MQLNRTKNELDREARNNENQNWEKIEKIADDISGKAFDQLVDKAKLIWKEPVNTFEDLPSNAEIGETRQIRSTGKVYRWDGTDWNEIQQIDAGPVNEVDTRLTNKITAVQNEIENASVSHTGTNYNNLKERLDKEHQEVTSQLAQTKQSKFNVLDYGAKLDGITDDTQAFQECANAIENNGGGLFDIPFSITGVVIKGTVKMPSNVILEGNNNLILADSTNNEDTPFYWENKENIIVQNLTINGKKELKDSSKSVAGGSNGLTFSGECFNVQVNNCYIYNTLEHGIHFYGRVQTNPDRVLRTTNIVITNCTFEDNGNPQWSAGPRGAGIMLFYGARNVKIQNNNFVNFVRVGIYIDSAYGTKSQLESSYPGLSVENGDYMGEDIIVSGNDFRVNKNYWGATSDSGQAVAVHGQKRCKITNNIINITQGKYKGISIDDGQEDSPTQDVQVLLNWITTTNECISIRSSKFVTVLDNELNSLNAHNIEIRYYTNIMEMIVVKGNNIRNRLNRGINIYNSSNDSSVFKQIYLIDNIIKLESSDITTSAGILTSGKIDDLMIKGNKVTDGYYGIQIGGDATNVNVENNRVYRCNYGIQGTGKVSYRFNSAYDCVERGIYVAGEGSNVIYNDGLININTSISPNMYLHTDTSLNIGARASESWKNPLMLGSVAFWIDLNGNLRKKTGKPTSETDGTIMATQ